MTDGWENVQKQKVKALNLDQEFDAIYYSQSEGLEFAKPHPMFFRKTLNLFNVETSRVVMVGDDLAKDYQGAKNMGIDFFHVQHLFNDQERMELKKLLSKNCE